MIAATSDPLSSLPKPDRTCGANGINKRWRWGPSESRLDVPRSRTRCSPPQLRGSRPASAESTLASCGTWAETSLPRLPAGHSPERCLAAPWNVWNAALRQGTPGRPITRKRIYRMLNDKRLIKGSSQPTLSAALARNRMRHTVHRACPRKYRNNCCSPSIGDSELVCIQGNARQGVLSEGRTRPRKGYISPVPTGSALDMLTSWCRLGCLVAKLILTRSTALSTASGRPEMRTTPAFWSCITFKRNIWRGTIEGSNRIRPA